MGFFPLLRLPGHIAKPCPQLGAWGVFMGGRISHSTAESQ